MCATAQRAASGPTHSTRNPMQSGDSSTVGNMDTMGVKLIDFFDVTPTSLWLEDYSDLRALFERWRAEGVTDLRAYLEADTRRVAASCISRATASSLTGGN